MIIIDNLHLWQQLTEICLLEECKNNLGYEIYVHEMNFTWDAFNNKIATLQTYF